MHLVWSLTHCNMMHGTHNVKLYLEGTGFETRYYLCSGWDFRDFAKVWNWKFELLVTFHMWVPVNFVSHNYLNKLVVKQWLKKSPAFHKPQISTTIFTRPKTKYYPKPDESDPSFPRYLFKVHFRIAFSGKHSYSNWSLQTTGTRWHSWLRHCSTSRNVGGSIPDDVIRVFHWHNPSGLPAAPWVDSTYNLN